MNSTDCNDVQPDEPPEVTAVEFRPDDGYPLCWGYMVGEDDGKSALYTTPEKALAAHLRGPRC
jgi:hypothetical protein